MAVFERSWPQSGAERKKKRDAEDWVVTGEGTNCRLIHQQPPAAAAKQASTQVLAPVARQQRLALVIGPVERGNGMPNTCVQSQQEMQPPGKQIRRLALSVEVGNRYQKSGADSMLKVLGVLIWNTSFPISKLFEVNHHA
jgi:hypothetical protein